MVHYSLDLESPTKSCISGGSNIWVQFKNTQETAQAIKGMYIWKSHRVSEGCQFLEAVCHPVITMMELVGVPRCNSGAGHRVSGSEGMLYCCTCLKMQSPGQGGSVGWLSVHQRVAGSIPGQATCPDCGFYLHWWSCRGQLTDVQLSH